jgi:hypothetical protein
VRRGLTFPRLCRIVEEDRREVLERYMKDSDALPRFYEELAERFGQLSEPRRRDHCFVLAAAAALAGGKTEEAERLRQRLLQVNPHHLLRPYTSMSEAVQTEDVRDYIADLRNQLPPERVEQLLKAPSAAAEPTYDLAHEPTPARAAAPDLPRAAVPPPPRKLVPPPATRQTASPTVPVAAPRRLSDDQPTAAGRWAASLLFVVALLLTAGVFILAFIRPLIE